MILASPGRFKEAVESTRRSIWQHLAPHMHRLTLWTPAVFAETHMQPNFLCLGSKDYRRLSVIQLHLGPDESVYLWQPSALEQLAPAFAVSHELNFVWSGSSPKGEHDPAWKLLTAWLVDKLTITEIERMSGAHRNAWGAGDAQAFDVARSLERAVFQICQREAKLASGIELLGASRRFGRVFFPISVQLASRATKRLAVIDTYPRPSVEHSCEPCSLLKDLSDFEGFEDGDLQVDEQLEIYSAWDGASLEGEFWEKSIRMAIDWLNGGECPTA